MKLADFPKVERLRRSFEGAKANLIAFETSPAETFYAVAQSDNHVHEVELLPVPREIAISAARRARDKIIAELAQLGVTVED